MSPDSPVSESPSASQVTFPTWLAAGLLAAEVAVLAVAAFPDASAAPDPGRGWAMLAGAQVLFVSWLWPTLGIGRLTTRPRAQAGLEALLLLAGCLLAAIPAAWWAQANTGRTAMPLVYMLAWLAVGWLMVDRGGPSLRWGWSLLMVLLNFGLLGLDYLSRDFLDNANMHFRAFNPMFEAASLSRTGWPSTFAGQWPLALPLALLIVLAATAILFPADRLRSDRADGCN
ncbi:MAG: hypothetical protein BIFFINMI_00505 [Phycisphaerae bacterium]|nr:hypothetical protein [Phycisphaerae bacterium]